MPNINEIFKGRYIIPIENLRINRSFTIGDVNFEIYNNKNKKELEKIAQDILLKKPNIDKQKINAAIKYLFIFNTENKKYTPLTIANVNVNATKKTSQKVVYRKVRLALHILKLLALNEKNIKSYDNIPKHFAIQGELIRSDNISVFGYKNDYREFFMSSFWTGYNEIFEITSAMKKEMRKNGWTKLNEILRQNQINQFEKRLLTAIFLYGEALSEEISFFEDVKNDKKSDTIKHLDDYKINNRFLKLFIALEALLIRDNSEPVINNISERSALILYKQYEKRRGTKINMKQLYKKRSGIVHHGNTSLTVQDLETLTKYTRDVILNTIKIIEKTQIKSDENFFDYFEKLKLS